MLELLKSIDAFAWGPPLLILLVGTGIYLTARLGLLQVLRLPKAFQLIFTKDKGHGDVSSFAALCTALAATVGTGNIYRGGDGYQGRWTRSPLLDVDGCFLGMLPSMRKDSWRLNTAQRTTMVQ